MRLAILCSVCLSCSCSCCRSASRQRWRSLRPCSNRVCSCSGGRHRDPTCRHSRDFDWGKESGVPISLCRILCDLGLVPPVSTVLKARVSSQGLHFCF